ncbi:MAG TPA: dihydrolipoyl dehydrogenase, partial [Desulfopila sp.]|nr:dihydrolipoyl dehydrogenase [Desulfopila sp.]
MAGQKNYDLLVIGAGPGGYVAAIRAAQLGLKTACIDKRHALGGTCLNVGCIPSKALLESTWKYHQCTQDMAVHGIGLGEISFDLRQMMERKNSIVTTLTKGLEHLFKKNRIERFTGTARLLGEGRVEIENGDRQVVEAENILVATGSRSAEIPGVKKDGKYVISSTGALELESVPDHLLVIGAGAIGLELGSVWRRLGAEVTVVEYFDRILPTVDKKIAKMGLRFFKKQGMKFHLGAKIEAVKEEGDRCRIDIAGQESLTADRVLLAAGRTPCLDGLGFTELGGKVDGRGFIQVDSTWQTSLAGVYAIGDVIGGAMLAHKASDEAVACVEHLVRGYGHVNYQAIPAIVYTHPEIATVGLSEEECALKEIPVKTGVSYFKGNGRALALDETEGMVKIVA